MDIPSNDILVGRDQGLSPYHMYLEKYFGIKVNNWDDLLVTISKQVMAQFMELMKFKEKSHTRKIAEHRQVKDTLCGRSGSRFIRWIVAGVS